VCANNEWETTRSKCGAAEEKAEDEVTIAGEGAESDEVEVIDVPMTKVKVFLNPSSAMTHTSAISAKNSLASTMEHGGESRSLRYALPRQHQSFEVRIGSAYFTEHTEDGGGANMICIKNVYKNASYRNTSLFIYMYQLLEVSVVNTLCLRVDVLHICTWRAGRAVIPRGGKKARTVIIGEATYRCSPARAAAARPAPQAKLHSRISHSA